MNHIHHHRPFRLIEQTLRYLNEDLTPRLPPGIMGGVLAMDSVEACANTLMHDLRGVKRNSQLIVTVKDLKDSKVGKEILFGVDVADENTKVYATFSAEFIYRTDGGPLRLSNVSVIVPPEQRSKENINPAKPYEVWIPFTCHLKGNNHFGMSYQNKLAVPLVWQRLDRVLHAYQESGAFDNESLAAIVQVRHGLRTLA